jgi:hypothetical protein
VFNWRHFQAFLWLRWRLRLNQLRRGGLANVIILGILAAGGVLLAIGFFIGCFFLGWLGLRPSSPAVLLFVWDGLVVAFLFFWLTGLLAELQRAEALSLDRFLHLPVSLTGAFLINYISSLFSTTLLICLPAMIGLGLGLVLARGPLLLLLFPLLAAFVLMVSALTYQFQGWLATLMANKRRRRTIIVVVTAVFVLLAQLPQLINVMQPWKKVQPSQIGAHKTQDEQELERLLASHEISPQEYERRQRELVEKSHAQTNQANQRELERAAGTARFLSLILPPGWLPLGVMDLAEGSALPALLGTLGLAAIGALSLWRSYQTTVRLYTGAYTSGKKETRPERPVTAAAVPAGRPPALLEKQLPWLSERAAAIALAGLRSLTRAPEAKMVLLTPIILVVVFGGMLLRRSLNLPEEGRPLVAYGAMTIILFSLIQLVGNQFGFDRSGFRVFVLCAARRSDVLLGKNLAVAPLALGLGTLLVVLQQVLYPMRVDLFLAMLVQLVSMFVLFSMLANLLSILAPTPVAPGSLKPTNLKGIPLLLHLAFVFLMPVALSPTLLPLGVEFVLRELTGWAQDIPICLLLSLLECAGILYLYRWVLTGEGALLQAREQKILEVVAARAE